LERACPLCNAMEDVKGNCPRCNVNWADGGAVNDYVGPYSPYETQLIAGYNTSDYCVHLLYCPICGYDTRVAVDKVTL
jgi:Zn-finger nucleic acid-binding protein